VAWVNESHELAVTVAYKYPAFQGRHDPSTKVLLVQTYVNNQAGVDLHLPAPACAWHGC